MDFKQLGKNPVQYLLGISICVIGYLYVDVKQSLEGQITDLQEEVQQLKLDNKELQRQYIELAKSIK